MAKTTLQLIYNGEKVHSTASTTWGFTSSEVVAHSANVLAHLQKLFNSFAIGFGPTLAMTLGCLICCTDILIQILPCPTSITKDRVLFSLPHKFVAMFACPTAYLPSGRWLPRTLCVVGCVVLTAYWRPYTIIPISCCRSPCIQFATQQLALLSPRCPFCTPFMAWWIAFLLAL